MIYLLRNTPWESDKGKDFKGLRLLLEYEDELRDPNRNKFVKSG